MPGINIDWNDLEMAFESHDPEWEAYLDRDTGEVIQGTPKTEPRVADVRKSARHLAISPIPSREQYQMMEDFIATVSSPGIQERLRDSIVGKGAFRRFKDALSRFPEERKRWFSYRDVLMHQYILAWLAEEKLEIVEMPAWNLELPAPASTSTGSTTSIEKTEEEDSELRAYLLAWARAHAEEHHYLFGPPAFERLATDMSREFSLIRRRSNVATEKPGTEKR